MIIDAMPMAIAIEDTILTIEINRPLSFVSKNLRAIKNLFCTVMN